MNEIENKELNNIENNILIADFMGLKRVEMKYTNGLVCFYYPSNDDFALTDEDKQEEFSIIEYAWTCYNLQYADSWEWLMEVVEKIENIPNINYVGIIRDTLFSGAGYYKMKIGRDTESNKDPEHYPIEIESYMKDDKLTKKQTVYLGVVEFIKWYNKLEK